MALLSSIYVVQVAKANRPRQQGSSENKDQLWANPSQVFRLMVNIWTKVAYLLQ